ncbi:mitochondrial coenzyme A transporter SLC25A42-like [Hetaerina americana]|uniref:mitochondrial coenzyme A transporter SLC25A42-like n=2 Tax=Hetaerina americana TaxID=62018 RepID=UPI003A7F3AE6
MARIVPSSGIAFAANDVFKHLLKVDRKEDEESKPARGFLAGAMAGLLGHTATYPLDVARTTMAVSSPKEYRNLSETIRGTIKKEGIRGLYAGYSASLIGVVPNAAIRFGMYGLLKEVYAERKGTELNPLEQGVCGAVSGATAMLLTYPLEVVRRHQQMAALTDGKKKSFLDTIKTIRVRQQFQQEERGGVSVEDRQGTRTQRSLAGEYGDHGEDRPFIGDCVRRK